MASSILEKNIRINRVLSDGTKEMYYPITKDENVIVGDSDTLDTKLGTIDTEISNLKKTATQSANGLMSSTDKTKLDGIADGANKTVVDTALSSTSTNPVQNKVVNTAIENLTTRFNNLIADAPEAYDTLKEISDYIATHKTEYDALLAITGNKVDKVDGKGLSTEDYTTEEKNKLSGIEDGANNYVHPTTSGNKHIPAGGSDGQILRWSADGTAVWGEDNDTTYSVATQSTNGLMSSTDKTKLDGIADGANNYVHPTTSGNKHIPAGGSDGQILRWSADGTAVWGEDNDTTYSVATQSADGLMSSTDKTRMNALPDFVVDSVEPTVTRDTIWFEVVE